MSCPSPDPTQDCLRLIAHGVDQRKQEEYRTAGRAFTAALLLARGMPEDESRDLRALALYNLSLLALDSGGSEQARQIRQQAAALLTEDPGSTLPLFLVPLFHELMADVLCAVGEFRRAIPFCEASIEYQIDLLNDPVITAAALVRAGKCYAKTGLRDHAAIPLRAAVKILRTLAGDPRLPSTLLDLGNALRKSNPPEAEQCYREVVEYHVAHAHLESATPAWVNLGVLCNEQGRYPESLAFYENALRVREQSPGTPPERIGVILNNIANTRRKMQQFAAAHVSVDRALQFLEPLGGHSLASAYGTKGLIYRDEQRDADAVEWFRKSAAEHLKMPSPNLSTLSEEVENQAAALERLGRLAEATEARHRQAEVRAAIDEIKAVHRQIADPDPGAGGAVLIELHYGRHASGPARKHYATDLCRKLSSMLEDNGDGYYGGRVVIPETTTLMFYGDDAERMFAAMQTLLREDPICAGAKITLRQAGRHRQVWLPGPVM